MSFQLGQKVVFFPVDGQLSEEFCKDNNLVIKKDENGKNIGGYLDPKKRAITALKLRGEKSEGIAFPIEVLSKYCDISKLKDGDQINILNGHEICCKYIPPIKPIRNSTSKKWHHKKKEFTASFPFFEEHKDTSHLEYNQNAFKEGDICHITLKMHGTSARTALTLENKTYSNPLIRWLHRNDRPKWSLVSGTRRVVLDNYNGGYYGSNQFREQYHELFKDKLPKGFEVFYEIVGWIDEQTPIMSVADNKKTNDKDFIKRYGDTTTFTYGCERGKNDIYVYRMTFTNEDGFCVEIPTEEMFTLCDKMGIKHVPLLDKFIFTTWDDLMERVDKYVDGPDPVGETHVREGVVVRIDNRETFTAYKHKNFSFKLLEGIAKLDADAPDIEEAQDILEDSNE